MRKAIINAAGEVVNLIEVEQATLDANEWVPPAGHTHIAATTDEGHDLNIGDTVHTATGRLKDRKPVPATLPAAAVLVYSTDESTPQDTFETDDDVSIKVTAPSTVTGRTILVPVDRLDAAGTVVAAAVKWLKMDFTAGVARVTVSFADSGRYGVGERTSKEFDVPETYITVHD